MDVKPVRIMPLGDSITRMTGKERFLKTLRFEEPDRPPHFESMFELEREAFGLQFPDRNSWAGCSASDKERKIATCMEIYEYMLEVFREFCQNELENKL